MTVTALPAENEEWASATGFVGLSLFTHSYRYHRACLRSVAGAARDQLPRYYAVRTAAGGVALVGLERTIRKLAGLRVKTLRSPQNVYVPYWDFCIPAPAARSNAIAPLEEIIRSAEFGAWDVMQLNNVLEGTAVLTALEAQASVAWKRWPAPQCDYLQCQDSDALLASVSKNFRASLRKARNKLHALADVEFKSHTSPQAVGVALKNFFALEELGWKGAMTGAIAQNATISAFYELMFEEFAQDPLGWVEINELWAEGKLLASQLCLGVVDTLFVLKIAYDEAYPKLSPGNMLLEWLVTRDEGAGRTRCLNLISDSSWHRDWAASHLKNWYIEIYNRTPTGWLMQLARSAQQRAGKHPLGLAPAMAEP